MKTCSKCGKTKRLKHFSKHPTAAQGKQNRCKTCVSEYMEEYQSKNKEALAAYRRTPSRRFKEAQRVAASRGLTFDLELDQYKQMLMLGVCHYCRETLQSTGVGLDRKNSELGYSHENCVPCCRRCNEIRGRDNIKYEEMFQVIELLNNLRSTNYMV